MQTLAATDVLNALASASGVEVTLFGDEQPSGGGAVDNFKPLSQTASAPTGTPAAIYTVGGSLQSIVSEIVMVNNSGGAATLTLTLVLGAVTTHLTPPTGIAIPSGGMAIWTPTNGIIVYNSSSLPITTGVSSVSNSDGTLTISPTTGAVIASRPAIGGDITIPTASNTAVVTAINGTTVPSGPAANRALVATGSSAATWQAIVNSLAVDGTSIVNAGTSSAPSLHTGTLNAIAAAQPTSATWSNNGFGIQGGITPVDASDFAIKSYVDTVAAGVTARHSAATVFTANVAITGLPGTNDRVTPIAGQVVLLTAQTISTQNGLWVVAVGVWTRPTYFATGADATGSYVIVEAGTVYGGSEWFILGVGPITIDTTAQTWLEITGLYNITVDGTLVKTGNQLSRAAITGDGSIATGSNSLVLATVNANVGTFGSATQVAQITANGKGLITGVAAVNIALGATGDATGTLPGALTLATVNTNVGTFGDSSHALTLTANGKGLITAVSAVAITPASIGAAPTPVPLADITTIGANTVLGNPTGSSAAPTTIAMNGSGASVMANNAVMQPRNIEAVIYVDTANSQGWAGSDAGAWINSAYAYGNTTYGQGANSGGFIVELAATTTNPVFTITTPIVLANYTNLTCCWLRGKGDGNGATILNFTPTSGICLSIGGGWGNDGGSQISDFTITGTAIANGATAVQWGATAAQINTAYGGSGGSAVTGAGATAKNVSIRRFTNGFTHQSGSDYATTYINCKVQQTTNGYTPQGENNNFHGGLFGGCTTGVVASNACEYQMFGVAFDDNTTTGVNSSTALARGTLAGCRFENAGGGTDTYITISAGAIDMLGGAMQNDLDSGTSTGFVQASGGQFTCQGTWLYNSSAVRTFTQIFNATGTAVVKADPVISPSAVGITQANLFTAAANLKVPDWFRVWNRSTANQTLTMAAGTPVYVAGSQLKMPQGAVIKVGTLFEWQIKMIKNAAGTTAFTFPLYVGTNGSTANTSVSTVNTMGFTQTAVVDAANVTVTFLVTTVGAAATGTWTVTMDHAAASGVGFGVGQTLISATGTLATTFNSTTAGLQFGIAINSQTGIPVVAVSCPSAKVYDLA